MNTKLQQSQIETNTVLICLSWQLFHCTQDQNNNSLLYLISFLYIIQGNTTVVILKITSQIFLQNLRTT